MSSILDKARLIEEYIINIRRDLHENPELSGQEFKTQEKIIKELDKLGISYKKVGNTSVIATLKGRRSGKCSIKSRHGCSSVNEESDVDLNL